MGKTTLASGFSWKRGFLANQQQHIPNSIASIHEPAKGQERIAGSDGSQAKSTNQRKIGTRNTAGTTVKFSKTTECAFLTILSSHDDKHYTTNKHKKETNKKVAISELTLHHTPTTPRTTYVHDDSHIHRVSPIRRLPPEAANGHTHLTQMTGYAIDGENHLRPQSTIQERIPNTGCTSFPSHQVPPPENLPKLTGLIKKLGDSTDPSKVMWAIDEWFEAQALLESVTRSRQLIHSADDDTTPSKTQPIGRTNDRWPSEQLLEGDPTTQ